MRKNIALSININKIALIRNSREGNNPNLETYAEKCILLGASGITVHPRPDQRHIRPEDCYTLSKLTNSIRDEKPELEFNIEGNPFARHHPASRNDFSDYPGFIKIIETCLPQQTTLVPDTNSQLTSDHGFDLSQDTTDLEAHINIIKSFGSRVSLFIDPDTDQISRARDIGADRIELYTGPFADAFDHNTDGCEAIFELHCKAAEHANDCGLGVNAGHDLNQKNLALYKELPFLMEVSIGHALTIDSLYDGLDKTVRRYKKILSA